MYIYSRILEYYRHCGNKEIWKWYITMLYFFADFYNNKMIRIQQLCKMILYNRLGLLILVT